MRWESRVTGGLRLMRFAALLAIVALMAACRPTDEGRAPADGDRELRVITSGGFAAAYDLLEPWAEDVLGIPLITEYGSSSGGAPGSIPVRLERGEQFDVIILSRSSLDRLTEEGEVRPDSRVDLVRSTIGMMVRRGEPRPDISSPEAFGRALVAAEAIGYSASASGTYLSTVLWPKMGIWEKLEPKARRVIGERVAAVVARGDVEVGFQQISEILPNESVELVGPIPDELQKVTTFSAGILERAHNAEDAKRLIDFLSSRSVTETIESTGLIPVLLEEDGAGSPAGLLDKGAESSVTEIPRTDSSPAAVDLESVP
jgi:molybdate transport system substrate-binding protein